MPRRAVAVVVVAFAVSFCGMPASRGQSTPPTREMTTDEARAALANAVPDTAPLAERVDALDRQRRAARVLGDQATLMRVLDQLVVIGRGQPMWGVWALDRMNTEYVFGSQQKAIDTGEALLADGDLSPQLRLNVLSGLAWKYCQTNDRRNCERVFSDADAAHAPIIAALADNDRDFATVQYLEAKGEVMRLRGDADARVVVLREALGVARGRLDRVGASGADPRIPAYRSAVNVSDDAAGQLVYALNDQGRSAESVAIAQEGLARARLGNYGPDGIGMWGQRLAAAQIGERRYDDALAASRASLDSLVRAGAQPGSLQIALARNAEVTSLINLERWQEADQTYAAFMASIRGDRAAYDRSYNVFLTSLLAAKNGRLEDAQKTIDGSVRFRTRVFGTNHVQTAEARAVRGAIFLIGDSPRSAASDYEDFFTALLDSPSGWLDLAPTGARGAYLNIVLGEYLRYAAKLYAAGGQSAIDDRMFNRLVQVADRLSSGEAQRSILESTARVRNADPALVALLDAEQEQRRTVREANGLASSDAVAADAKDTTDDRKKELREQLKLHRDQGDAAQKKLDDTRRQIAKQFPSFVQLVNPVNPNIGAIRKVLAPDEAFVGLYASHQGTFAWAIAASGKTALVVSPWTPADVARRVAAMRATLDVGDRLPRLPPIDVAALSAIHDELVRPLRPALAGVTVIDVSAGGVLASVPFAALATGSAADPNKEAAAPPWLVREFAIAETPGAAAFVSLRAVEARTPAPKPLIGFGDPQFRTAQAAAAIPATPGQPKARNLVVAANAAQASTYSADKGFRYASIPALPETRDELIALANALGADPGSDLVLGAAATRRAVLTTPLADRRVVAFATHGLLPGEIPTLSKPALAMAATDAADESPLLTLDDVLSLKLNAQWVVLSACNTAGGERDGAAMSGLVRGFFFAGTRSVLATYWAVESEASRQLVARVFAEAAADPKSGRAADLRAAQLAMIDGTIGAGAYRHPFYWAPYALFGDPLR